MISARKSKKVVSKILDDNVSSGKELMYLDIDTTHDVYPQILPPKVGSPSNFKDSRGLYLRNRPF